MRRTCSTILVFLLLLVAVAPAWSAASIPDCCLQAANHPTALRAPGTPANHPAKAASRQAQHEHCARMKMGEAERPVHRHDHTVPGVAKDHLGCQCPVATSGVAFASLIRVAAASIVPATENAIAPHQVDVAINLNMRSQSERGPPAFLQS
jgi:hypothetical protein